MNKGKNALLVFISILLGLIPFVGSQIQADNVKPNQVQYDLARYNKLNQKADWKYLSKIWKFLNSVGMNPKYSKEILNIVNDKDKIKKALDNLVSSKLLSQSDSDVLYRLFSKRIVDLEFKTGIISCYEATAYNERLDKTEKDIENRFDLLESLAKQNKINSKSYQVAKDAVYKDFKILAEEYNDKNYNNFSGNIVELIYYLGK